MEKANPASAVVNAADFEAAVHNVPPENETDEDDNSRTQAPTAPGSASADAESDAVPDASATAAPAGRRLSSRSTKGQKREMEEGDWGGGSSRASVASGNRRASHKPGANKAQDAGEQETGAAAAASARGPVAAGMKRKRRAGDAAGGGRTPVGGGSIVDDDDGDDGDGGKEDTNDRSGAMSGPFRRSYVGASQANSATQMGQGYPGHVPSGHHYSAYQHQQQQQHHRSQPSPHHQLHQQQKHELGPAYPPQAMARIVSAANVVNRRRALETAAGTAPSGLAAGPVAAPQPPPPAASASSSSRGSVAGTSPPSSLMPSPSNYNSYASSSSHTHGAGGHGAAASSSSYSGGGGSGSVTASSIHTGVTHASSSSSSGEASTLAVLGLARGLSVSIPRIPPSKHTTNASTGSTSGGVGASSGGGGNSSGGLHQQQQQPLPDVAVEALSLLSDSRPNSTIAAGAHSHHNMKISVEQRHATMAALGYQLSPSPQHRHQQPRAGFHHHQHQHHHQPYAAQPLSARGMGLQSISTGQGRSGHTAAAYSASAGSAAVAGPAHRPAATSASPAAPRQPAPRTTAVDEDEAQAFMSEAAAVAALGAAETHGHSDPGRSMDAGSAGQAPQQHHHQLQFQQYYEGAGRLHSMTSAAGPSPPAAHAYVSSGNAYGFGHHHNGVNIMPYAGGPDNGNHHHHHHNHAGHPLSMESHLPGPGHYPYAWSAPPPPSQPTHAAVGAAAGVASASTAQSAAATTTQQMTAVATGLQSTGVALTADTDVLRDRTSSADVLGISPLPVSSSVWLQQYHVNNASAAASASTVSADSHVDAATGRVSTSSTSAASNSSNGSLSADGQQRHQPLQVLSATYAPQLSSIYTSGRLLSGEARILPGPSVQSDDASLTGTIGRLLQSLPSVELSLAAGAAHTSSTSQPSSPAITSSLPLTGQMLRFTSAGAAANEDASEGGEGLEDALMMVWVKVPKEGQPLSASSAAADSQPVRAQQRHLPQPPPQQHLQAGPQLSQPYHASTHHYGSGNVAYLGQDHGQHTMYAAGVPHQYPSHEQYHHQQFHHPHHHQHSYASGAYHVDIPQPRYSSNTGELPMFAAASSPPSSLVLSGRIRSDEGATSSSSASSGGGDPLVDAGGGGYGGADADVNNDDNDRMIGVDDEDDDDEEEQQEEEMEVEGEEDGRSTYSGSTGGDQQPLQAGEHVAHALSKTGRKRGTAAQRQGKAAAAVAVDPGIGTTAGGAPVSNSKRASATRKSHAARQLNNRLGLSRAPLLPPGVAPLQHDDGSGNGMHTEHLLPAAASGGTTSATIGAGKAPASSAGGAAGSASTSNALASPRSAAGGGDGSITAPLATASSCSSAVGHGKGAKGVASAPGTSSSSSAAGAIASSSSSAVAAAPSASPALASSHSVSLAVAGCDTSSGMAVYVSLSDAGMGMMVREDGVRLKGKLDGREQKLVEDFCARVLDGSITAYRGELARAIQLHVNPSRPQEFFEKLVSRRKLNDTLPLQTRPKETAAAAGASAGAGSDAAAMATDAYVESGEVAAAAAVASHAATPA